MSPKKLPRYRTGDPTLDDAIAALVADLPDSEDDELIFEMIVSAVLLAQDRTDRGDLKIANAALKEMRAAFALFAPYRAAPKAAIFGSARTRRDDPLYLQTERLAAMLADAGWMVITGAGPGIMEAGISGAGVDRSFGVGIRLPFETTTGYLADDPKLLQFRYFFTRKVNFMKESDGFVLLPGGFGTMDEAFELLTLIQTGKAPIAPVVLLDVPGGTYWKTWEHFVRTELGARSYIDRDDLSFVRITDDYEAAVAELLHFYRNYHSQRYVQGDLVIRLRQDPDDALVSSLNAEFSDIVTDGVIDRAPPSPAEVRDGDHIDRARLRFRFDRRSYARLRQLVDRLNDA